jgi:glutathione S-transferase
MDIHHVELVSFNLCPFVQRVAILLQIKQVPFEITYIDLADRPAWFKEISPLGKVPLLRLNHEIVLFESAVINEFLDEAFHPSLHSTDIFQKACERAWIEFSSELLRLNYLMVRESDSAKLEELKTELFSKLQRVEPVVIGPYFRGDEFSLVDAAFAPFFMRMFLADSTNPDCASTDSRFKTIPKVVVWAKTVLAMTAVKSSVVSNFSTLYREAANKAGSLLF